VVNWKIDGHVPHPYALIFCQDRVKGIKNLLNFDPVVRQYRSQAAVAGLFGRRGALGNDTGAHHDVHGLQSGGLSLWCLRITQL